MEELDLLRKQIDDIDKQLVELFEKRMELAVRIGIIKEEMGLQIMDSKREEVVIRKATAHLKNKELTRELESFFHNVMDSSKRIQFDRLQKAEE